MSYPQPYQTDPYHGDPYHGQAEQAVPQQAVPQQAGPQTLEPAPVEAARPAATAEAARPAWTQHATTTRGLIGRPASLAAVEAAAASRASGLAMAALTEAISEALPRTADLAPDPPPGGTVYGRPQLDRAGKLLSGRMARLHIGWHAAPAGMLAVLRPPAGPTGLVLGTDAEQRAVAVRLFRTTPTRITLVGGEFLGYLVVLRAAALGAVVSVWTDEPARWREFADRVTPAGARIVVNSPYQLAAATTAQTPQLLVTDDGSAAPADPGEARPWRAQLTVLRGLDGGGKPALASSNLVLAQRLTAAESLVAAAALNLPATATAPLQRLDDETVALLTPTIQRYARLTPTDIERGYAGHPRR